MNSVVFLSFNLKLKSEFITVYLISFKSINDWIILVKGYDWRWGLGCK